MSARFVTVFQRRLVHYRVPFFERLRARLAERGFDLQLVHGHSVGDDRLRNDEAVLPWATPLTTRSMRIGRFSLTTHPIPLELVRDSALVVVPHELTYLPSWRVSAYANAHGVPVAVWGHGRIFQGREHFGAMRRWLASRGDVCFAYTSLSAAAFRANGVPAAKIVIVDNAVESPVGAAGNSTPAPVCQPPTLGFLGSLTAAKCLPLVVECVDELRHEIADLRLRVVGDGPERAFLLDAMRTRPWLEWHGTAVGSAKVHALRGVAALLNPGMVGLALLDSFALGIPMIAVEAADHSPEVAYLEPGRNGVMVSGSRSALVAAARRIVTDRAWRDALSQGCLESARRHTLDAMVGKFADAVVATVPAGQSRECAVVRRPRVVLLWRSYLPYHVARLRAAVAAEDRLGVRFVGVEVTSDRTGYEALGLNAGGAPLHERLVTAAPSVAFASMNVAQIRAAVGRVLDELDPAAVFCPATPFPEGMAAVSWCLRHGRRVVMMDDSWDATDRSSAVRRGFKQVLHGALDGVFVPSAVFAEYWAAQGVPRDRLLTAVDVVDNAFFRRPTGRGPRRREFLFVGRDLPRKGLPALRAAHAIYAARVADPWKLVIVGPVSADAASASLVEHRGVLRGVELRELLWDAGALVVPSDYDQWALVVNEAMAAGLPVAASHAVGAARALITDGETGWRFSPGDVAELAATLARASLASDLERSAVAERALERLERECSLETFVAGIERALRLPRVVPAVAGRAATLLWRGHVRAY